MAKRDYLVDAARQIRMALDREVSEDYEAAFNYYKKGVDLLLNGIQVDPNMERREAVKRKTTQYLKRAEDIFLSHLQNNMEKEGSQMIGSSSLRFRPIRRLNALVEDLKMYKVIDIGDKVLTVESIICKDTFVIKSLPKTSGNTQSRPTIIPQEVPYMVKLLRYYVSEDSIYLHLEHVTGGKLFSKLHNLRGQASRRDRPESFSTGHHHQKSCTLSSSTQRRPPGQHVEGLQSASGLRSTNTHATKHTEREHTAPAAASASEGDHPTPAPAPAPERDHRAPAPASWHEAQRQMESCRTHSYCEETGCLQQHSKLIQETLIKQARMEASQHATAAAAPHSNNHSNTHGASQQQHPITTTSSCNIPSQHATATASVHSNHNNTHGTFQQHPTTTSSCCGSKYYELGTKRSALSIRGVGQLHTGDFTGQVLPGTRCGDARDSLQNTVEREETQGHLGSLQKEEPQRRHSRESESESSLRSPPPPPSSSGLARVDTQGHGYGTPPEPSVGEQTTIEGHGSLPLHHSLQDGCSVQTSRGGAQHGHWGLPEEEVQAWGAQILMALESLHQQGVICCDLNPNNILLSDDGAVCLTFFGQWGEVEPRICTKAMEQMYCAPEVGGLGRVNEAADWWSLGALLFELLTGMPLWQCHPTGVTSHTQLHVPEHLSTAAASLLTELLQLDAGYRLGSGGGGVSDIKCHPFFHSVEWADLES
ncbi:ribosomal protein S6 kinase-like 1 [Engraulis encrasicolus]|uniref:ribosomal protein S6 kinase-like 1 n=1 Tax=Engraulis encrasicolus TaxID=184585 RepID=UPI002FD4CE33